MAVVEIREQRREFVICEETPTAGRTHYSVPPTFRYTHVLSINATMRRRTFFLDLAIDVGARAVFFFPPGSVATAPK